MKLPKLELVEGWRSAWRWWSMWAHVIGTSLGGLLVLMPTMPAEVQALVPLKYRAIAVAAWLVGAGLLRIVKQPPKP